MITSDPQYTHLRSLLNEIKIDLSAQAISLLTPHGTVLQTLGTTTLITAPIGLALAQSMAAFYQLVAKGTSEQIFFAYDKGDYHLVCTGKNNAPFLVAAYHSMDPPPLGARKFYLQQAYQQSGLKNMVQASAKNESVSGFSFPDDIINDVIKKTDHNELLVALQEAAEDMQAHLVLAADDSGNTIEFVGKTPVSPNEISALAALSMATLGDSVPVPLERDCASHAFLDGPYGAVFLAQSEGGLLFLAVLSRQGSAGMARLTLKHLLRQEWEKIIMQVDDPFTFEDFGEVSFSDVWTTEDTNEN